MGRGRGGYPCDVKLGYIGVSTFQQRYQRQLHQCWQDIARSAWTYSYKQVVACERCGALTSERATE